jgi:hypothetical protein
MDSLKEEILNWVKVSGVKLSVEMKEKEEFG